MPASFRWSCCRQHPFAGLVVASVLSSLAGLSLCQHPFAGLLASVLSSLASLAVSVLSSLADPAYASILLLGFFLAFSRLLLVLLSAFSHLSLILLVDFHRSIEKGSAIEKPYNRDYLTSIDYKQAIT